MQNKNRPPRNRRKTAKFRAKLKARVKRRIKKSVHARQSR